jgi:hypothetical protein
MEIGPNCCWADQFAQFVGWGGDIIIVIIGIICVLRSNVFNGLVLGRGYHYRNHLRAQQHVFHIQVTDSY